MGSKADAKATAGSPQSMKTIAVKLRETAATLSSIAALYAASDVPPALLERREEADLKGKLVAALGMVDSGSKTLTRVLAALELAAE